jgi:hypothetical protein
MPENKGRYTICESCVHAYGDDCFSIPPEERHWVKDCYIESRTTQPNRLRYVYQCDRYKRGRRPLVIGGREAIGLHRVFEIENRYREQRA